MKKIEKNAQNKLLFELHITMKREHVTTLGELKKTDYKPRTIQEELAHNLKEFLRTGKKTFEGLIGYENTVIPDVERAILSDFIMIISFVLLKRDD